MLRTSAGLSRPEARPESCRLREIFAEQVSSVAARAKLTTALEFVREGDVRVVTKPEPPRTLDPQPAGYCGRSGEARHPIV
jgi:hypothetical protein